MEEKYKVVLVDFDDDLFAPPGKEAEFLQKANACWHAGQYRNKDEIISVVHDADVVMIQSLRLLLTGDVIRKMEKCRCIIRLGIGYDSVDVKTATELGIMVCNIPLYCIDDVAEHTLAMLLDAVRHIGLQDRLIRQGKWDRRAARPSRRIKGSTFGLLSFGRIARGVAQRAKGLGMKVLAFDPYVGYEEMANLGVIKVEMEDLLKRSDFVSVHTPLTDATHHLLGKDEFAIIKQGAVLVNTSRGGIIDTKAMVEALKNGKLMAAALDVMEEEPLPASSPLRELDNVILTPHVGAYNDQSNEDLYRAACEIACEVLYNQRPPSVVNPEVTPRYNTKIGAS